MKMARNEDLVGAARGAPWPVEATMRKFTGRNKTYTATQWVEELEKNAAIFGWSPTQKLLVARRTLTETAALWLKCENIFRTFDDLKTALLEEFSDSSVIDKEIHETMSPKMQMDCERSKLARFENANDGDIEKFDKAARSATVSEEAAPPRIPERQHSHTLSRKAVNSNDDDSCDERNVCDKCQTNKCQCCQKAVNNRCWCFPVNSVSAVENEKKIKNSSVKIDICGVRIDSLVHSCSHLNVSTEKNVVDKNMVSITPRSEYVFLDGECSMSEERKSCDVIDGVSEEVLVVQEQMRVCEVAVAQTDQHPSLISRDLTNDAPGVLGPVCMPTQEDRVKEQDEPASSGDSGDESGSDPESPSDKLNQATHRQDWCNSSTEREGGSREPQASTSSTTQEADSSKTSQPSMPKLLPKIDLPGGAMLYPGVLAGVGLDGLSSNLGLGNLAMGYPHSFILGLANQGQEGASSSNQPQFITIPLSMAMGNPPAPNGCPSASSDDSSELQDLSTGGRK